MASKRPKEILKNKAIKEIYRCANDPIYFIEKYCIVRHPLRGLVPFILYPYQKKAITSFIAHDRVIINKARQLGYSTVVAVFIVWLILFRNDKEVLIIANQEKTAKNLLKKVKLAFAKLPEWLYLADIERKNETEFALSNGSSVFASAASDDAGRSHAVSLLVFDEAAHIQRMGEIWKAAASTVSTGGKILALSTPCGLGNWFHEYFTKAESGENPDWYPITTHWWENPEYAEGLEESSQSPGGYTSPWFKKATQGWTRQEIAQEYLTSFIESGENYFNVETMEYYESLCVEPIRKEGPDRNLWIWKDPIPGYRYLISADASHGSGEDFSTFYVQELKDMEMVAEYKAKLQPDLLGELMVEIGERYNNAYLCPEAQGIGNVTGYTIKNLDYRNLCYFDKETGRLIDQWSADYKGVAPGQPMTVKERPMILAKAEEFLRKKLVKCYSKRFLREMQTFIVKNRKPQAEKGMNDDLIMSMAIGIWVRDICPEFRGAVAAMDMMKALESVTKTSRTFNATNSREFAIENHKKRIKKMMEDQKYPARNAYNNYKWIYKA